MTYDIDNGALAPPPPPPPPVRPRRFAGLGLRGATALAALGLVGGGVAGGYVISQAASTGTATPTPSSGSSSPGSGSSSATGTFHSNEDPTHEAGESAQREAQENAGQVPTVP